MRTFMKIWLAIGLISIGIGIGLTALMTFVIAAKSNNSIETFTIDETYEKVTSLDFHIAYGEVFIKEGKEFKITSNNLIFDNFESYVQDGTWVIEDNAEDYIDLFGVNLPIDNLISWDEDNSPTITITVPEGFVAEDIALLLNAGYMEADVLRSKKGTFKVNAGSLRLKQVEVYDSSEFHIGAGEMILDEMKLNDIRVDVGVGSIKMDGNITGTNDISCGIGKIAMDLEGDEKDYSFKIDYNLGNVIINNMNFHKIFNKRDMVSNSDTEFNLDCGIGSIIIKTNE
ncbi:DUF4097 family beta strand repeat protein [Mobilitalea sibirica]|uniref:DUF4097 family beta strand repeat protein n=1 Tax=Mobilitalea sibirica TaxID=1462919 RepID=A0A8J7H1N2_9FIRM|nr:DUF4097 family beta strand repeat-containing protein [Mobilitalea sibirica]MBH1940155.1 DUF4097 family beta strand repeat protein [Mobilitalea sibirica]